MELHSRVATPEDAPLVAEILNEALEYKLARNDMAWATWPFTAEDINLGLSHGNTYLFNSGRQTVGTAILMPNDARVWGEDRGNDETAHYLHRVAIRKHHHGRDIGKLIVAWAAAETIKADRQYLRLDCPTGNQPLRNHYEELGFVLIEEQPAPFQDYGKALYQKQVP